MSHASNNSKDIVWRIHLNQVGGINDDDDYHHDDHGEIGDDPKSVGWCDVLQQKLCCGRGTLPFPFHGSWLMRRRNYGRQ
mmetsp:Transcript_30692/g.42756  ORF Transcript_30692/g.42756 Transcript_30692/m.42756 type:complete len:80 (+) Transcript_30692:246-485(+)